jgi:hypothetical protein
MSTHTQDHSLTRVGNLSVRDHSGKIYWRMITHITFRVLVPGK